MHPFDLQHTLLAKHAQHVVLVHFPIALVCVAMLFEVIALRTRNRAWSAAAFWNLSVAAAAVLPVAITGVLAWRWQLEAAPIRGILRLHLTLAIVSGVMIFASWILARRDLRTSRTSALRIATEVATTIAVAVTAHLGGIVSGVNS